MQGVGESYDTTVWGAPTAYCCSFYGPPEGIPEGLVITVIFPFASLNQIVGTSPPGLNATVCNPVKFQIKGVAPNQAQGTTAISQTPRADIPDEGVAIKPANFGVQGVTSSNRAVFLGTLLFADWANARGPKYVAAVPPGLPSQGPYTPVDVIGPRSVRNAPGNVIDVYNYTSKAQANASTRTVTVIAVIPNNNAGVVCPH